MISSTVEDYLKAFLKIEDKNEKASTSNVARHLSVADASVTDMLRKLQKVGLLVYKPYYGATLTPEGRKVALRILRRHRLIELFLNQVMGFGWEQVHDEAERLEHAVSDFFVDRIDAILGYPQKDPHGEAIPDAQGFRKREVDIRLSEAEPGQYTVRKVTSDSPEFLAYIERESMTPGMTFVLLERTPFQGPLVFQVEGRQQRQYLGIEAAKSIYVLPAGDGVPDDRTTARPNLAIFPAPLGGPTKAGSDKKRGRRSRPARRKMK